MSLLYGHKSLCAVEKPQARHGTLGAGQWPFELAHKPYLRVKNTLCGHTTLCAGVKHLVRV